MMMGLIQSRTNKVGHTGIDDDKLLFERFLHIEYSRDERTALAYDSTSQLEVQLLAAAQVECVAEYIEVGFKIGDGVFIRIVVIDTQAASYIDVLYLDIPFHQIVLQAVDAFAEYPESLHVQDLRSDMKVEADKLYMRIALQLGKYAIEHLDGNTEFVFTQARRDVLVGMCVDIGVQPQGNRGYRLFFCGPALR